MARAFSLMCKTTHESQARHVVGVIVLPDQGCDALLRRGQLDKRTIEGLGFFDIGAVESVTLRGTDGYACKCPTLYYFIREPCPQRVFVARLTPEGRKSGRPEVRDGDPVAIIPAVSGFIWQRFIAPPGKAMPAPPPAPRRPEKVLAR